MFRAFRILYQNLENYTQIQRFKQKVEMKDDTKYDTPKEMHLKSLKLLRCIFLSQKRLHIVDVK